MLEIGGVHRILSSEWNWLDWRDLLFYLTSFKVVTPLILAGLG
jgi:hypothetical protein